MFNAKHLIIVIIFCFCTIEPNLTYAAKKKKCPQLTNNIDYFVEIVPKEIDYDFRISQKQLNRMAGGITGSRGIRREKVLGLTSTQHEISYKMSSQPVTMSKTRFCARINSVSLKIRVKKLKVYVLNKYKPGTCQHNAIIEHEHEHVSTFQNGLKNLKDEFENRIWGIIRNLPPGIGTSPRRASKAAFKYLDFRISRIKDPIEKQMQIENENIDTPLSYRKLTQKCNSW